MAQNIKGCLNLLYDKYKLISIITILFLLTIASINVNADMNSATPQASSFTITDKGSSGQGGDLFLPINVLTVPGRNGLDVPINLIYSSSDNTLRKESSEVGYGFSLGTASAITRSVNGVPDEMRKVHLSNRQDCVSNNVVSIDESGWLYSAGGLTSNEDSERTLPTSQLCGPSSDTSSQYNQFTHGVYQGNSDSFYISLNGQGSRMIFDSNNILRLSNVQPWKVDYAFDPNNGKGTISKITVTIEDGTKYVFEDLGVKTYSTELIRPYTDESGCSTTPSSWVTASPTDNNPYTYAWPLIQILSNNYKDIDGNGPSVNDLGNWVKFQYSVSSDYKVSVNSETLNHNPTTIYKGLTNYYFPQSCSVSASYIKDYQLINVVTPAYQADLDYSARGVLDIYSPPTNSFFPGVTNTPRSNLAKLDQITLKQNPQVSGADLSILKTIQLSYKNSLNSISGKLTLDSIQEIGKNGLEYLPPTKFNYYTDSCNGKENKYGLCQDNIYYGLLKSITYPTNGKVTYVYGEDSLNYFQNLIIRKGSGGNVKCETSGNGLLWSADCDYAVAEKSGTRLSKIYSDDGSGQVTTTNMFYGNGVLADDPFCRKINPPSLSSFIGCYRGSNEILTSFGDSDIGRSSANNIVYDTITTSIGRNTQTYGVTANGETITFYQTAKDYKNVCSGNGNCLTSFDYQLGIPTQIKKFNETMSLKQNQYITYTADNDKDFTTDTYSQLTSPSRLIRFNIIPMYDWNHLNEDQGDFVTAQNYIRAVPDSTKDVYGFISSNTFKNREQIQEWNNEITNDKQLISSKSYYYNDLPSSTNYGSGIGIPGPNFNGQPSIVTEDLVDTNCQLQTGYNPYYYCKPINQVVVSNNYAFQSQSALSSKNMKTQPGTSTVTEKIYSYDSQMNPIVTSNVISKSVTSWSSFNNDPNQLYVLSSTSYTDISKNKNIVTQYISYDNYGNNLALIDPRNTMSHITYDPIFNKYPKKTWIDSPGGGSESNPLIINSYDSLGNIISTQDINNKITVYDYDSLGRLKSVQKPDDPANNPSQKISYCYALDLSCNHQGYGLNNVITEKVMSHGLADKSKTIESISFADGLGKVKQSAVIESIDPASTIRLNDEYFDTGKVKASYQPTRDTSSQTSGTLQFNSYSTKTTAQGSLVILVKKFITKIRSSTRFAKTSITGNVVMDENVNGNIVPSPTSINLMSRPEDPTKATLFVYSVPSGAQIYLDSETNSRGNSPLTIYNLELGSHTIKLKLAGYTDYIKTRNLIAGDNDIYAILSPIASTGTICVDTNPSSASVYLDSETVPRGVSNLCINNVPIGNHVITLKKTGYIDTIINVNNLLAGETRQLSSTLVAISKGSISITTTPYGAEIYLDSETTFRGITSDVPLIITNLNPGIHLITASLSGYPEKSKVIEVFNGQIINADFIFSDQLKTILSTKFDYTHDPLYRISLVNNTDNTTTINYYSSLNDPITINSCTTSNARVCQGTSNMNTISAAGQSDYFCRYDNMGCKHLIEPTYSPRPQCSYSCQGSNSESGCLGTSVTGAADCTNVDTAKSYYNSNNCYCYYTSTSTDTYSDGSSATTSGVRQLLLTKTYNEKNTQDSSKGISQSFYDRQGNLVRYIDEDNKKTDYEYNSIGKVTKITNANNQVTLNGYDGLGRLTRTINPDVGDYSFIYDNSGNLIQKEFRKYYSDSLSQQSSSSNQPNSDSTLTFDCPSNQYNFPTNIYLFSSPSSAPIEIKGYNSYYYINIGNTPLTAFDISPYCTSNVPIYSFRSGSNEFLTNIKMEWLSNYYVYADLTNQASISGSIALPLGSSNSIISKVYLDGSLILSGMNSYSNGNLILANIVQGTHSIRLEYSDLAIQDIQINVVAGVKTQIYLYQKSEQNTGSIFVTTTPQGESVQFNGNLQDTPLLIENLPPSTYRITLSSDPNVYKDVAIVASSTPINVNLDSSQQVSGSIFVTTNIDSTDGGAQIYLDSETDSRGNSPLTISNLNPASHTIIARLSGYNDAQGTVIVSSGQVSNVNLNLVPVPIITNYEYDGLNRLKKIIYQNDPNVVYTYDDCYPYVNTAMNSLESNTKGRLCRVNNGYVVKEMIYDSRGRVSMYNTIINGKSYVTTLGYDSADNLISVRYPSNYLVLYIYNKLGKINAILANGKTTNISYNPEGTISNLSYPNGINTDYLYTPKNQLKAFNIYKESNKANPILNELINYDPVGNIKSLEDTNTGLKAEFKYDNVDRLTKVFNPNDPTQPSKYYNALDYNYDAIGNRLKENNFDYTYEPGTNRLLQVKNNPYGSLITDFSYDNQGNVKSKTYNNEFKPCNITSVNVNGRRGIVLAFDNKFPAGLPIKVIYDSSYFDNALNLNNQNKHYEWGSAISSQGGSINVTCNGVKSQKIVSITPVGLYGSLISDNAAKSLNWYANDKVKNIKVYNPARQTEFYSYDSENRLRKISYTDGTCSTFYYDDSGLRVKKIENNLATNYIYNGNNMIYEDNYNEKSDCGDSVQTTYSVSSDFSQISGGVVCYGGDVQTFTVKNTGSLAGRIYPVAALIAYNSDGTQAGSEYATDISPAYADLAPSQSLIFSASLSRITSQVDHYKMKISVKNGNSITSNSFSCQ